MTAICDSNALWQNVCLLCFICFVYFLYWTQAYCRLCFATVDYLSSCWALLRIPFVLIMITYKTHDYLQNIQHTYLQNFSLFHSNFRFYTIIDRKLAPWQRGMKYAQPITRGLRSYDTPLPTLPRPTVRIATHYEVKKSTITQTPFNFVLASIILLSNVAVVSVNSLAPHSDEF